jgi:hypothetical protein
VYIQAAAVKVAKNLRIIGKSVSRDQELPEIRIGRRRA